MEPTTTACSTWMSGEFAVLDFETTGHLPAEARICQIGIARFRAGRGERHSWLVDPGVPIPPEASQIHGIYDHHVQDKPRIGAVWPQVAPHLRGLVVVGYNLVHYDLPVLCAELDRAAGQPLVDFTLERALGLLGSPAVLDVFAVVDWHYRHARSRKLGPVCEAFGVALPSAHDAGADALATGELLLQLARQSFLPSDMADAVPQVQWLRAKLDQERQEFGHFVYRDRRNPLLLRLGFSKNQGEPLDQVDPGFFNWALKTLVDLPPAVEALFRGRAHTPAPDWQAQILRAHDLISRWGAAANAAEHQANTSEYEREVLLTKATTLRACCAEMNLVLGSRP